MTKYYIMLTAAVFLGGGEYEDLTTQVFAVVAALGLTAYVVRGLVRCSSKI